MSIAEYIKIPKSIRAAMFGPKKAGKSQTCNTIFMNEERDLFPAGELGPEAKEVICHEKEIFGVNLKIVDTPGELVRPTKDAKDSPSGQKMVSVNELHPGPHVILLVSVGSTFCKCLPIFYAVQ